jgi:hypothetical protein
MTDRDTSFWQVMDRVAAAITVLTLIGGILTTILEVNHITKNAKSQDGVVIAIVGLGIAGLIASVSGVAIRRDAFRADRGRPGTRLLWIGAILLLMAFAGTLALGQ